MKKIELLILLGLASITFVSRGQTLIESFDAVSVDPTYVTLLEAPSTAVFTDLTTDKVEGVASLKFHANLASVHDYGTYAQRQKRLPEGSYFDWSRNDTLSLWIKVLKAPKYPESFVFRIHVADQPSPSDNIEEYIYENGTIIDAVSDWVQLKIPLFEREVDSGNPDETGFILFPASWSRSPSQENNKKFDYNKIVGFNITAVSTTNAADSVEFLVDKFEALGLKEAPLVVFNGKAVPSELGAGWVWGQSTLSIEEGAGVTPQKNAIKWTQGDEYGNGWTGIGWTIDPPHDLSHAWASGDSIKFKYKSETWSDTVDIAFETSSTGKVGILFVPKGDNQWHEFGAPLSSAIPVEGTTGFDPASIGTFGIMAGHPGFDVGTGVAGSVIWFDDIWTGHPEFDVISPAPPSGLAAIPGSYTNLITWQDVPGEEKEHYNIYYSRNPITDVATAEVAATRIEHGVQTYEHVLRAPATDQDVSYYYAITCTDASGNISDIASTGPVTNTAQGVVVISLNAPSAFTADGNLSEWSGITPIHLAPSGGGYIVQNTTISSDADLSLDAYLAVDNTYLYVAMDVEDDIVSHSQTTTYQNDSPDLFLGLYNWHGASHTSYRRGAQPDYHFRFAFDRALIDGLTGGDSLLVPGENYYWGEKFPTGYVVEARIPWTLLHDRFGDDTFTPVDGDRIPIDFSINDADETGSREGILTYSPINEDQSWNNVSLWLYTWIGTAWLGVEDNNPALVNRYSLSQNYPNPFNPATQIIYSLEKPGVVTIKVYDVLGRYVATIINDQQNAGMHTVNFNASGLSSGIYFYQLNSGSFTSSRKMILMK
ncbi:MAG TPA: sugar-binding protein [Ignavibacteriaceae bacterium]|nr:sugar-binding protein [Ignavibacteriaceae bacterium]